MLKANRALLFVLMFAGCLPSTVPLPAPERVRRFVPLIESIPPRNLADGAELVVISGIEASEIPTPGRERGKVRVTLDRPGKKVFLILSCGGFVDWQVDASPGTAVTGIVVGSWGGSARVETGLAAPAYGVEVSYASRPDSGSFVEMMRRLNEWFGVDRVDVFRGWRIVPAIVYVAGPDPPNPMLTLGGPPVSMPRTNFEFDLFDRDLRPVRWSLVGPANAPPADNYYMKSIDRPVYTAEDQTRRLFALSGDGRKVYAVSGESLEVRDRKDGGRQLVPLPANFPNFGTVTDVAYDTRHDVVALTTHGGRGGRFYRFDAAKNRWLDFRSGNDVAVSSMAYDPQSDRFLALAGSHPGASNRFLLLVSDTGRVVKFCHLAENGPLTTALPGLDRLYDGGNSRAPRLEIAARGDDVAFIAIQAGRVRAIWHYEVATGKAELTYGAW